MTSLPPGWASTTIGEVADYVQRGRGPTYAPRSTFPVINQKCIRWDGVDPTHLKFIDESTRSQWSLERHLMRGDVLWNSTGTGTLGRAAVFEGLPGFESAVVDSHVTIVRSTKVEPRFIYYWIRSPAVQTRLEEMQAGSTNQVELPRGEVMATKVPLAPLNEQRRIVTKLDAIFERTRATKKRLERLPAHFVQLKRSILAAAFRGDLTADWRESHPDIEPASDLAARIRAQRDERTSLPVETAYSSELPETELPGTWFVALTANVGSVQLGRQLSAGKYTGALHPYVRVANVADDRLSFDDIKEMEFSPQELSQYLLRPGDIVLSEGQSLDRLGQSAMYRAGDPAVCYQKTLNRFRATEAGPLPEYAQLYFRFCMHTGVFRGAGSITTNIAHLTQEKLRRIPFILCPLEEQRVLVERVRGALARLDEIEAAVATVRAKLDALEQSALAKAFRGELVAQDLNDEPAARLLERLRAPSRDLVSTTSPERRRPRSRRADETDSSVGTKKQIASR